MAQVIECLPTKREALNSNYSITTDRDREKLKRHIKFELWMLT
jgi:hypothetical protein